MGWEEYHGDVAFNLAKVGHSGSQISKKDMGDCIGVGFSAAGDEI